MPAPAYFVSGIGTEVGKTVISALLVRYFEADYWKPVQCGELDYTDSDKLVEWAELADHRLHPERFRLQTPASPHYAAAQEGLQIQLEDFSLPATSRPLIVEGAGGLFVPLNDQHTVLDLIERLGLPVFLVSRHYLGSINHTLLSIEALRQRNIPIAGLIYSGRDDKDTAEIIEKQSGIKAFWKVEELDKVSATSLEAWLKKF